MGWKHARFDPQVRFPHCPHTIHTSDQSHSVITRWSSQYNSFLSISRSRDPLRDWTTLPEVQAQLKEKDCPALLPEAIRILRSAAFWDKLEIAMAVIKPVHDHQVCLHDSPLSASQNSY